MALWETKREVPVNANKRERRRESQPRHGCQFFISLYLSTDTVLKQLKASLEFDRRNIENFKAQMMYAALIDQ